MDGDGWSSPQDQGRRDTRGTAGETLALRPKLREVPQSSAGILPCRTAGVSPASAVRMRTGRVPPKLLKRNGLPNAMHSPKGTQFPNCVRKQLAVAALKLTQAVDSGTRLSLISSFYDEAVRRIVLRIFA